MITTLTVNLYMIFGDIFTYKGKESFMCIFKIESKDISQTKKTKNKTQNKQRKARL